MTFQWGRLVGVVVLCSGLWLAVIGGAIPGVEGGSGNSVVVADDVEDEPNETVRHQHPDLIDESGDLEGLTVWLAGDLSDRLDQSAVNLSQGEYDAARSLLGKEYGDRYGQFVSVAGETDEYDVDDDDSDEDDEDDVADEEDDEDQRDGAEDEAEPENESDDPADSADDRAEDVQELIDRLDDESPSDPSAVTAFERSGSTQEALVDLVEAYYAIHDEYLDAVDDEDDDRARELARDLETLAAAIDERADWVQRYFETITTETDEDLSDASAEINRTNTDVQDTQFEIRSVQFDETSISVNATNESISFTEPLTGTVSVTTLDGEPIPESELAISIPGGETTIENTTDGELEVTYRPITLSAEATQLPVEFVPDRQSRFLGNVTMVNVSVTAVEPAIGDLSVSNASAFGDSVSVDGVVTVDTEAVGGLPVEVVVDGEILDELVTTTDTGTIDGEFSLPAFIPAGEHEVIVRVPDADRAITGTSETTPITVLETDSELSVFASQDGADSISVSGTLSTVDGEAIGGQPVTLFVDGEPVETVTTDSDGSFATGLVVGALEDGDVVDIDAEYDEPNSNLAPSNDSDAVELTVAVTEPADPTIVQALLDDTRFALGAIVAILVGLLGSVWAYRRRSTKTDESDSTNDDSRPSRRRSIDDPPANTVPIAVSLIDAARSYCDRDRPVEAIEAGYAAVRSTLDDTTEFEETTARTHWEFFRQHRDTDEAGLETVTRIYEAAAYGPHTPTVDDARQLIDAARQLCEWDQAPAGERTVGDDD